MSNDPTQEQSIPTGRFQPMVSIRRHFWLSAVLVTIVLIAGVFVALQKQHEYVARAVILISPKFINNLKYDRALELQGNQYYIYINHQKHMMRRADVLKKALAIPEVRKIWMIEGEKERKAIKRLQSGISIKSARYNPLLTVKLKSTKKEGLHTVLNAVLRMYLAQSREENFYDKDGRLSVLKQRRTKLRQLIPEKQTIRNRISRELGVTTFQEDSLNPYDGILINSTSVFTEARRQRVESEARLHTLRNNKGETSLLASLVAESLDNNVLAKSLSNQIVEQRTTLATQLLNLTPQHPNYQRVQQQLNQLDRDLNRELSAVRNTIRAQIIEKHVSEVQRNRQIEESLAAELEYQREQATHYVTEYNRALALSKEIERANQQLRAINDRIDFFQIESTAPGFARLDTAAIQPRYPEGGSRKRIVIIFAGLAFVVAVILPILIDMLDRRVQTPGEVHKILGFPPLAWVLKRDNEDSTALASDQLRRLALTLARDFRNYQSRYFTLTSVKPQGGTTSLILELAHYLNELGVNVLALEMNAYNPDVRYHNNITTRGLVSALQPNSPFLNHPEQLVLPATHDLPARLPVGAIDSDHLTTYGNLPTVLKRLSNHYDFILLDSPPILLSSDAELIGETAGGVLLVIEARQVSPGELKRATRLLERLSPPVVGAIINKVAVFNGGGYFAELIREYASKKKLPVGWLKRKFWDK